VDSNTHVAHSAVVPIGDTDVDADSVLDSGELFSTERRSCFMSSKVCAASSSSLMIDSAASPVPFVLDLLMVAVFTSAR